MVEAWSTRGDWPEKELERQDFKVFWVVNLKSNRESLEG